MMLVDFQQKGRPVVQCSLGAGPVSEAHSPYWSEIAPRPGGRLNSPVGVVEVGKKKVCTMCTRWVSDQAVPASDWSGFRMFGRESSVCKGWSPVRVPPRAQCFRRSEAFCVFFRVDSVHTLASDLMFRVCGVPETAYSVVWGSGCLRGTGYRPEWSLLGVHPRPSFRWVFAFTTSWWLGVVYNMIC
jgi:hypothetical protein